MQLQHSHCWYDAFASCGCVLVATCVRYGFSSSTWSGASGVFKALPILFQKHLPKKFYIRHERSSFHNLGFQHIKNFRALNTFLSWTKLISPSIAQINYFAFESGNETLGRQWSLLYFALVDQFLRKCQTWFLGWMRGVEGDEVVARLLVRETDWKLG